VPIDQTHLAPPGVLVVITRPLANAADRETLLRSRPASQGGIETLGHADRCGAAGSAAAECV
jgi:hypothetical protein